MHKNEFVRWIQSLDVSGLLNLSKDRLEQLLGKDFAAMKGYSQNNPHHCYDLLEHTIRTVEALDFRDLNETYSIELKIAALFHDIGKPIVAFEKNGRTVFYNHAIKSRDIAEKELGKYDLKECSLARILFYIEHHDDFISFKLKSDVKDKMRTFTRITSESVYKKIIDTQEACRKSCRYIPTINDYAILIRLCVADVKAQSLTVVQEGELIDSSQQKLERLTMIEKYINIIGTEKI